MQNRNRILKQEEQMKKIKLASVNPIREHDIYVSEIFDAVIKLYSEYPNCFDKGVVNYKIGLSENLLYEIGKFILTSYNQYEE